MANPVPARLSHAADAKYTALAGRKFGLTIGAAFLVLAAIGRWRDHPVTFLVLGTMGVALLTTGLVIPAQLGPVERAWMHLAKVIAKITTPVFMGVVYFVILTPTGVLRRLIAGSGLARPSGPDGFWVDRRSIPRSALDRQF